MKAHKFTPGMQESPSFPSNLYFSNYIFITGRYSSICLFFFSLFEYSSTLYLRIKLLIPIEVKTMFTNVETEDILR